MSWAGPRRIEAGDTHIALWEAGDGPPVLLLHGFPGTHRSWEPLLPHLPGHRLLAIDLPGYGGSGRPDDAHVAAQADRIAAMLAGLGLGPIPVIGHDWGGTAAWVLAAVAPRCVSRLVVLDSPHPQVFERALRTWDQARRSWYMGVFLFPRLAAAALRRPGALSALFRGGGGKGAPPDDALIAAEEQALLESDSLPSALAWYRDSLLDRARVRGLPTIAAPTLVLWGGRDVALGTPLAHAHREVVPNVSVEVFPELGHWPHWGDPAAVGASIGRFLSPG